MHGLPHEEPDMKSWLIHDYGTIADLRLEDAREPEPGADEVVIRVDAASVNPLDVKLLTGALKEMMPLSFPYAPGTDAAGVVERAGAAGGPWKVGDRVATKVAGGAFAERLRVPAGELARLPAGVSMIEAAGLPTAAGTAWEALMETGGLRRGQSVLVHAASGGVGHFAVQLAKLAGARVTATTSEANLHLVSDLGADDVIDYRTTDFREQGREFDLVLDPVGGDTQRRSMEVLRQGGLLVSLTQPPDAQAAQARGIRAQLLVHRPRAERLEHLAALVAEGRLRVVIDSGFAFADVPRALERVHTGKARGKVLVELH
jgi:NADPH:quinone reductase-like Zn-dependent oxidoreductase